MGGMVFSGPPLPALGEGLGVRGPFQCPLTPGPLSPVRGEGRKSACRSLFHRLQQLPDDRVAADAFGLGGEAGGDAVAQHRQSEMADVIAAHIHPAVEGGVGFRAVGSAPGWRGPAPQPTCSLMNAGTSGSSGPRRPHQVHRVAGHVLRHRESSAPTAGTCSSASRSHTACTSGTGFIVVRSTMSSSSCSFGYLMKVLRRKRSFCASGSG